jgi:hypothetical protein
VWNFDGNLFSWNGYSANQVTFADFTIAASNPKSPSSSAIIFNQGITRSLIENIIVNGDNFGCGKYSFFEQLIAKQ